MPSIRSASRPRRRTWEQGAAVAEFVLVVPLLLLLGFAAVQIVLLVHARANLAAAATEAARVGALSASPRQAAMQAMTASLERPGMPTAQRIRVRSDRRNGVPLLSVEVRARGSVALLDRVVPITVTGWAVRE